MMKNDVKILLAEDDMNLGNLLADYLKAKGFHTVLASNGEEAFNVFVKGNYNLCLLDVMMPVKDGLISSCSYDGKRKTGIPQLPW